MNRFFILIFLWGNICAASLLIPMDRTQTNHIKAYGLAYGALKNGYSIEWLLNYRGGAFLIPDTDHFRQRAILMEVFFQQINTMQQSGIYAEIQGSNMERVILEKAPRIAIYSPPNKDPWDDAVTLALSYAEIPYDVIWDREVLEGKLFEYDWLHLHHEDFTGQHGKFYGSFKNAAWYQKEVQLFRQTAYEMGYDSVQKQKCAVAKEIQRYVGEGGFLFAMCSAADSIDIALAADGVDIIPSEIDGTPADPDCQKKLNFKNTFAFENFKLEMSAYVYEFSDIDVTVYNPVNPGVFNLFEFSAKYDRTASILTQCHEHVIMNFLGQTTAFNRKCLKKNIVVLGEISEDVAKYIHGNYGKGTFTFLGGHDPEDYAHAVYEKPTNLEMHKNSAGYRLILNNILYPAAEKKKLKT